MAKTKKGHGPGIVNVMQLSRLETVKTERWSRNGQDWQMVSIWTCGLIDLHPGSSEVNTPITWLCSL